MAPLDDLLATMAKTVEALCHQVGGGKGSPGKGSPGKGGPGKGLGGPGKSKGKGLGPSQAKAAKGKGKGGKGKGQSKGSVPLPAAGEAGVIRMSPANQRRLLHQGWPCKHCQTRNMPDRTVCISCTTVRGAERRAPLSQTLSKAFPWRKEAPPASKRNSLSDPIEKDEEGFAPTVVRKPKKGSRATTPAGSRAATPAPAARGTSSGAGSAPARSGGPPGPPAAPPPAAEEAAKPPSEEEARRVAKAARRKELDSTLSDLKGALRALEWAKWPGAAEERTRLESALRHTEGEIHSGRTLKARWASFQQKDANLREQEQRAEEALLGAREALRLAEADSAELREKRGGLTQLHQGLLAEQAQEDQEAAPAASTGPPLDSLQSMDHWVASRPELATAPYLELRRLYNQAVEEERVRRVEAAAASTPVVVLDDDDQPPGGDRSRRRLNPTEEADEPMGGPEQEQAPEGQGAATAPAPVLAGPQLARMADAIQAEALAAGGEAVAWETS